MRGIFTVFTCLVLGLVLGNEVRGQAANCTAGSTLEIRVTKLDAITGQTEWQVTRPIGQAGFDLCINTRYSLEILGGPGTLTATWTAATPSIILSGGNTRTVTVRADVNGAVALNLVLSGTNCSGSQSYNLNFGGKSTSATFAALAPICSGSSTTLTLSNVQRSPGGSNNFRYTWSNGTTTTTTSVPTLTVSPASTTTYSVSVYPIGGSLTDDSGYCTAVYSQILNTRPLPNATANVTPASVCQNNPAQIEAGGAGGSGTYTWSVSSGTATSAGLPTGATTPGGQNNSVEVTPTAVGSYRYRVTATDQNGCQATAETPVLQVTGPPVATLTSLIEPDRCDGDTLTHRLNLSSGFISGVTSYNWRYTLGGSTLISGSGLVSGTTSTIITNVAVPPDTNYARVNFTLEVSNGPNCSATLTINGSTNSDRRPWIFSRPIVSLAVSPSTQICSGQSVTINASCSSTHPAACTNGSFSTLTYNWNVTGSGSGASITNTPTNTRDYRAIISKLYFFSNAPNVTCRDTSIVNVVVNPTPTVAITAPSQICANNNLTLSVASQTGVTYAWGTTANNATTPTVNLLPTNNTSNDRNEVYTVTATQGNCTANTSATVTIRPSPSVGLQVSSPVCRNTQFNLDATVSNEGSNPTYTWSTGATTRNTVDTRNTLGTFTYSLVVTRTGATPCSTTRQVDVVVQDCGNASIGRGPSKQQYCPGETVTITPVGLSPSEGHQWEDGTDLPFRVFNTADAVNGKIYYSMGVGFRVSVIRCDTLKDPVDGWYLNASNVRVDSLPDGRPNPNQAFIENCRFVQGLRLRTIIEDSIVVSQPTPIIAASRDTVCAGDTLVLKALCQGCALGNVTPPNNNANLSYTWEVPALALNAIGIGLDSLPLQPLAQTRVYLTVTDAANCTDSTSKDIFFKPIPGVDINGLAAASLPKQARYCPTGSVGLRANTDVCDNCTFSWSTGQVSRSITVNRVGRYFVTVTNRGCPQTDSVDVDLHPIPQPLLETASGQLIPSPTRPNLALCLNVSTILRVRQDTANHFTYLWNTGATSPQINVNDQGGFFVQATDTLTGCVGFSAPVMAVRSFTGANPVASGSPPTLCGPSLSAAPAVLSVPACENCSYQWFSQGDTSNTLLGTARTVSVTTTGSYFAVVTNSGGCRYTSNLLNVGRDTAVNTPLISSTADTICPGQFFTLSTPAITGASYQWILGSTRLSSATNRTFTTNIAGAYQVEVRYPNGCVASSANLNIIQQPFNPSIFPTSGGTICAGDVLTLSTPTVPGYAYQWYRDGNLIAGATASSYDVTTGGQYHVFVTRTGGCGAATNPVTVETSALVAATAYASNATICPNEETTLNVSLCAGCSYEWFNQTTGQPVSNGNSYIVTVNSSGVYFARVRNVASGCAINSNLVTVTSPSIIRPSINTSRSFVCEGVQPVLTTTPCTGCSYTWLKAQPNNNLFQPIPAALNQPSYQVFSSLDTGRYRVAIRYPSGCVDTSVVLVINSARFNATIGPIVRICNTNPITLNATASTPTITNVCQSGNCLFRWTRAGVLQAQTNVPSFQTAQPGDYKVIVRNTTTGCEEESPIILLDSVRLNPVLSSSSRDICGNDRVLLTVTSCPTCIHTWNRNTGSGFNPIPGMINTASRTFLTPPGSAAVGSYTVNVTDTLTNCTVLSSLVALNQVSGLDVLVSKSAANICQGDSVSLFRTSGSSPNTTFRWFRNALDSNAMGFPIPTATVANFMTNQRGFYRLEVTNLVNNCVDTSFALFLDTVNVPVNFALNLSTVNPMPMSAAPINLYNYLSPASFVNRGQFRHIPFSAAVPIDTGLSGPNNRIFDPVPSGAGFHRIVYRLDTLGCVLQTSDTNVIRILDPAGIAVINQNPNSVSYEACVADTLNLVVSNLSFSPSRVYFRNQVTGLPQLVTILANNVGSTVQAGSLVYNGSMTVAVPNWAGAGPLRVENTAGNDSINTPFLLVHNEDLTLAGLPNLLCSNGSPISLVGSPLGGTFTLRDSATNNIITGAFAGTTLNPQAVPRNSYNAQGRRTVRVVYQYPGFYTNGNACPQPDTIARLIQIRGMFLDSVRYSPISVSQNTEQLTNLVRRVFPHSASPNQWRAVSGRTVSFAGSFITPAGNPTDFLPRNAGQGRYAMRYIIRDSVCEASIVDSITVLAAPSPLAVTPNMCWNAPAITFGRDAQFSYQPSPFIPIQPGRSFRDTFNLIRVTSSANNARTQTVNASRGLESYRFLASASNVNQVVLPNLPVGRDTFYRDTLLVEYLYRRLEYIGSPVPNQAIDSTEYVIASIRIPILIEDTFGVVIARDLVNHVYCEQDRVYLLGGLPANGNFFLRGGTGNFATEQILPNGLFNPGVINQNETTDQIYRLRYSVSGLACQNQDTMSILIPKAPNPAFRTASGLRVYCQNTEPDTILVNLQARDISSWVIGGVAQPAAPYFVDPNILAPGQYIGIHQIQNRIGLLGDTILCFAAASDTFVINPLPNPRFINPSSVANPAFSPEYCTNDSTVLFIVQPTPSCQVPPNSGVPLVVEGFESSQFPPANWEIFNISGNNWTRATNLAYAGNACAFIDSSSSVENSWLISPSINMVTGRLYRIEYYVRTSAPFTNCPNCDPASLRVTIGNSATPAGQTRSLAFFSSLDNTMYELRSHDFLCPATGTYYVGFQAESGANSSRWIRLDNIRIADISNVGCASGGLGSVIGAGTSIVQDSLFSFRPTQVASGTMTITYNYTDANGCQNAAVQNLLIKPHPSLAFNAIPDVCANANPISVVPNPIGGRFTSSWISGTGPFNFDTLSRTVLPRRPGTERLLYTFTATNGCTSTLADTFTVFPILDTAAIVGLFQGYTGAYCQSSTAPIPLDVAIAQQGRPLPASGVFAGPGVRNGQLGTAGATFQPNLAVADMGRTGLARITYTYTTSNGCVDSSIFLTRIQSQPQLRFDNLPDSICANAANVQIRVRNQIRTGWQGERLVDSLWAIGAPNTLFTGPGVSSIGNLVPSPSIVGFNPVVYNYADSFCTAVLRDTFRVDSIPVVRFQNVPTDRFICENSSPFLLLATPPYFPGSGFMRLSDANGLVDSVTRSFYRIDPRVMATPASGNRMINIFYETKDSRGCIGRGLDSFEIRPYPRITFTMPNNGLFCQDDTAEINLLPFASPSGGLGIGRAIFRDNLPLTAIRQDSFLQLRQVGPRVLRYLYLDSLTMCSHDTTTLINVYNTPDVSFAVLGGCALDSMQFAIRGNNLNPNVDSVTSIFWDFGDGTTLNFTPNQGIQVPNAFHRYVASGSFTASLAVANQGLCVDTFSQTFVVSPLMVYDSARPYVQTFDAGHGGWFAEQPDLPAGSSSIWSLANLNGARINDNGNTAWVTHAQAPYTYGPAERAWVYSPCFDMRQAWRPMITFDLWRDMSPNIDGAVMEYYDYNDFTWKPLGRVGRGIDWYQTDFLLSRPGNQPDDVAPLPRGWTGSSNGWEKARYRLDGFAGQTNMRLRLAFATDSNTILQNLEGMAFDSVWIGERGRNALVEHFSNLSFPDIDQIDHSIYNLIYSNDLGRDVNLIQYNVVLETSSMTNFPDSLFTVNRSDPNARTILYGINEYAQSLVDGLPAGTGSSRDLSFEDLEYNMLQYPAFRMQLAPININNNTLEVQLDMNTLLPLDSSEYALFVAITQDSIYIQRDLTLAGVHKHSVLRKMLPNPDGLLFQQAWRVGNTFSQVFTWNNIFPNVNPLHLQAVAFIQNTQTKEVYQSATTRDLSMFIPTNQNTLAPEELPQPTVGLKLFPNPAQDYFNIAFTQGLDTDYQWQLIDPLGRVLRNGIAQEGLEQIQVQTSELASGMYFFVIYNKNVYTQRQVVIRRP